MTEHSTYHQQPDEEIQGTRSQTKKLLSSWSVGPCKMPHGSILIPYMEALWERTIKLSFGGFMEASSHSHDWLSHRPVETGSTSGPSCCCKLKSLSRVQFFATPWTGARQASLSITNSWSLLKLMSIESVMPSNHFILCHPLLLLPSIFPHIRAFSNGSVLRIRWPKYWSFSFSINPSSEYLWLISFRIDWFDLAV